MRHPCYGVLDGRLSMAEIALAVTDLPIVEFGCEQISFAQLVQLIGEKAANDLLRLTGQPDPLPGAWLGWLCSARYWRRGLWRCAGSS
jgi:hypothetical protein